MAQKHSISAHIPASLRLQAAAVLLVLAGGASGDQIYKFVDENGVVTYSAFKPIKGAYEHIVPSCLLSYIGCEMSRADWNKVPLNRGAYQELIAQIAQRHGVDAALIRAIVHAESSFNHTAVSRAGAQGLMQLMPVTQKRFGVTNPFNVAQNLDAGTRLLKLLLAKYRYDIKLAAAAYNAGEGAVERYRGVPPYEETKNYVRRVTQLYSRYQQTS